MGRFVKLENDIFSIFGSDAWLDEEIKTFPANYESNGVDNEYIRVSIVPSGMGINTDSASGILIIDIFTANGKGPRRASEIADVVETFLVGKSINTVGNYVTQFYVGSLAHRGTDKDNPSLFRSTYNIPFNYFGAQQ